MQIWMTLVLALQLLAAVAMIGLVLIQHGKGADMGASFGSGASGSLFGATGSANFLSRSTAACATVFFGCTLALVFMSNAGGGRAASSGSSVLDRPAVAASAPVSGAIPGAIPSGLPNSMSKPAVDATGEPVAPAGAASAAGAIPTK